MALWKFSNKNKYGTWRHRIIALPDGKPFSHGPGFGSSVNVSLFRYTHEHRYPPALFVSSRDGQKYIIPGYQKVLPETTLKDIVWIKPESKVVKSKDTPTLEYKFESKSEPGSFYVVKVTGDKVKCNCAGQYRAKDRQCKHMKEVIQKLKNDNK